MKTKFTMILACAGLACALATVGCSKDDDVSSKDQTLDSLIGKATITGIVYIDNDHTQKVAKEEVASDATIIVSYNTKDLAYKSDANAISFTKMLTTKTDANGKFSISIDANNEGVNYTIQVAQYLTNYVRDSITPKNDTLKISNSAYFSSVSQVKTLQKGQSLYTRLFLASTPEYIIPN